ncbi:unnamed protein product, partial [Prunus brigantina]
VDITQKVTSLKVFYKVHAKDVVKKVLDDRCIANLVGHINGNEEKDVEVESDGNEADNEEEDVEVESDGNEADNEEEDEEVEYDGSEAEKKEKDKDEELKDSDYKYNNDEMSNIETGMTGKMRANVGEEEPNIDPEMMPPNEGTKAISDNGEDTDALPPEGVTYENEQESEENSNKSKKRKKRKLPNFKQFRRETGLRNP